MLDLCLVNCKLDTDSETVCLGIENGKILSIKKLPSKADTTLDLQGKIVLPGLIDAHVHFRDPGLTHKEDFGTGSSAAAAGGFTTVLDMPNTIPATDTPEAFKKKIKIGKRKSLVDFGLHAGVGDLSFIGELAKLRPASFKIFMDLTNSADLIEAFSEINRVGGDQLISLHAEDGDEVRHFTKLMKKEGSNPELYAQARPPKAEIDAVINGLFLARKFRQKIHFCHVSTRKSLQLIFKSQKARLNVTSEITPHHLFLDSSYLSKFGTLAKTNPPLRDKNNQLDVNYLSMIDIIGTDHAPHTMDEKGGNIWDAPPGVPGIENILSLLLTLLNQGKISFKTIRRLLCENPAKIFNIPQKGFIKEGMDADLTVVDLKMEGVIDPDNFKSKSRYTPFEGFQVRGMPTMTLVRGRKVMEDGEIIENKGKYVYMPK